MKDLESDIVELETIRETTGDRGYIEILKEKKMALANLLDVKVQGALVRSRFLNINEMDAPTSFFFGLEKKNGQRRVIHSLLSGTGQEITEPSQIRRRAVSFYSTLYTSEYEEGETLSEGFWNGLPQVSEEANSQLEGPLTIQELQTALQGMQGRRAPGIDGLSVEFYRAYWDVLSNDLLDVFNESLASGSMPVSCRRAVITLLPKKGNLQDIKNWRPVSLLCVDYKLLSKALATRLGRAVEQVIHRDQTYCVPGRSMVDNVHLIRDVLEVSSSLDINTGLISLDQEKAFDRVEHSFLWKVNHKAGGSAQRKRSYPRDDNLQEEERKGDEKRTHHKALLTKSQQCFEEGKGGRPTRPRPGEVPGSGEGGKKTGDTEVSTNKTKSHSEAGGSAHKAGGSAPPVGVPEDGGDQRKRSLPLEVFFQEEEWKGDVWGEMKSTKIAVIVNKKQVDHGSSVELSEIHGIQFCDDDGANEDDSGDEVRPKALLTKSQQRFGEEKGGRPTRPRPREVPGSGEGGEEADERSPPTRRKGRTLF
ncbi:hypothetical protein NHX12_014090 [Muraenolepis orangiensis]|uniref:Reverse transcriptase domain-containing protein n=1 Tax=Muraenolepis orangiensis TaxID=630683 RepID=A0A9Q0I4A0_9TELE|nr:hypothetical protein NHX12_014090 [Muraenolepis orangiensis]